MFKIKNYTLFQLIWAKYTLSTARTSYKLKTRLGERVRHYFAARLRKRSVFRKPLARKKEPVRRFYARPRTLCTRSWWWTRAEFPAATREISLLCARDRPYAPPFPSKRRGEEKALNPTHEHALIDPRTKRALGRPASWPIQDLRGRFFVRHRGRFFFLRPGKTLIKTRLAPLDFQGARRVIAKGRGAIELSVYRRDESTSSRLFARVVGRTLASRKRRRTKTIFFASIYEYIYIYISSCRFFFER